MPVNQKRLLEKILTLEVANNVVARELNELKKEFTEQPQKQTRKSEILEQLRLDQIRREKTLIKNRERKLQNQ